jgi:hypothetical protein
MSYERTNFKTGWSEKAWIEIKETSCYSFISDFKCKGSGKKLNAESLFVSRTNFKHRGNETDELYFYNRDSTPDKYISVWEEWDNAKRDKIEEIMEIAREYNIRVNIRKEKSNTK